MSSTNEQFDVEKYFDSLSDDIMCMNLHNKNIHHLPSLKKFKSLLYLDVTKNNLTKLPELPSTLIYLYCSGNNIKRLPQLNCNLIDLYCSHNQLTCLPVLPNTLKYIDISGNSIKLLPELPYDVHMIKMDINNAVDVLIRKHCSQCFYYYQRGHIDIHQSPYEENVNNRPFVLVLHKYNNDDLRKGIRAINEYNRFVELFYSYKYKNQFRKWLWEKVRLPKIQKEFNPYINADLTYRLYEDIESEPDSHS